jgi:hypothetical protein
VTQDFSWPGKRHAFINRHPNCQIHPDMLRSLRRLLPSLLFAVPALSGELYYTGFETNPAPPPVSFPAGFDIFYTSPSPDDWRASSAHSGLKLHSIEPESVHTQAGMGNVVYLGGNPTPFASTASNQTVRTWKVFNTDPVTSNQEIVTLSVLLGISDSTSSGTGLTRRDNFEFTFYNQSGQLIGFIQFDNNTLDTTVIPPVPGQYIRRSSYNTATSTWEKPLTGDYFFHDTIMHLVVRINFRTNRWTAQLDDLALFSDEIFYTGPGAKNLGSVAAQMQVMNSGGFPQQRIPGDNFMLFDDFFVRADPVPAAEIYEFTRSLGGAVSFTWLTEAQYRYQVQYTDNLSTSWLDSLPGSLTTAAATGTAPVFTDTTAASRNKRWYRIKRMYP